MKKYIFVVFAVLGMAFYAAAQNEAYERKEYATKSGEMLKYRMLSPKVLEKNKKYPLVLFFHGAGERGDDNESQLRNGGSLFSNPSNRDQYPSFVLFPQCPTDTYWPTGIRPEQGFLDGNPFEKNFPISVPLSQVAELIDDFIANNPVDTNRIYVMGLSMGGMATFDFVCRFPNRFAAAVAICGAVNEERLREFQGKTSFRIYHGDIDNVIPVSYSRNAYQALHDTGKKVTYTEFYGVNHGSWNPAFNDATLMPWLYSQKK
ncbi:MAG: prolyl oligopeptidase family serine peptidase [Capnocytophaga sp.]|nr:prolyl oligopeptidase family serine peptidase [Capnocytophaga sp.]